MQSLSVIKKGEKWYYALDRINIECFFNICIPQRMSFVHHCLKTSSLNPNFLPPPSLLDKTRRFHLVSLFGIILISARPANPLCHCIIHGAPLTKFPFMWAMCPERKSLETWISPNGLYLMAMHSCAQVNCHSVSRK